MDPKVEEYLRSNQAAGMVTTGRDGFPHVVRVGVCLVDGKLWSSGTAGRLRTRHLRRDPRATLFVFGRTDWSYLTLETEVKILDGPDAPEKTLRLFRVMQNLGPEDSVNWFGEQYTPSEFLEAIRSEGRLIYQFEILRSYGSFPTSSIED